MLGMACLSSLGQYTRSDDVGHRLRHSLSTAHMVIRRWTWHVIIFQGWHTQSIQVWYDIPLSPLDCTHWWTMSGMTCHHIPWTKHMVGRHWAWHAIIALWQDTRSDDVERGTPAKLLDSTHIRMMYNMACNHSPWTTYMSRPKSGPRLAPTLTLLCERTNQSKP